MEDKLKYQEGVKAERERILKILEEDGLDIGFVDEDVSIGEIIDRFKIQLERKIKNDKK